METIMINKNVHCETANIKKILKNLNIQQWGIWSSRFVYNHTMDFLSAPFLFCSELQSRSKVDGYMKRNNLKFQRAPSRATNNRIQTPVPMVK